MAPPSRRLDWIVKNIELLLALAGSLTVGVMDLFGDALGAKATSGATVLVLGALAAASLRQRRLQSELLAGLGEVRQAMPAPDTVKLLGRNEISEELQRAREQNTTWFFKGGTGTYLRAVTLPLCVERARLNRTSLTLNIEIVDPTHEPACNAYANFRSQYARIGPRDVEAWTPKRTSKESYATILAAALHRQRLPRAVVHISLSSTAPALRFDGSETHLVITQDDPAKPGLMVPKNHPLHGYLMMELEQSKVQAKTILLTSAVSLNENPTVGQARDFFSGLGLALPPSFTDTDVGDIVQKALRPENPYPI
ncbi:hypothetical protein [Streptomyces sp. IBSBF 2435]|uniref:hypothetical protein n=1 Tax=Streptomyces sp. IBSBF 2435 TaxID=2903531 RepID=UPI002FDC095E